MCVCVIRIIIIILFDGEKTEGGVCELFRNICENHQECVEFSWPPAKIWPFSSRPGYIQSLSHPSQLRIRIYNNNTATTTTVSYII